MLKYGYIIKGGSLKHMLYQVFMEVTNIPGANKNLELYEFDKEDKEKIIDEIIVPYLQKSELQFSGYFLTAQNIIRIVVKTTDESISRIRDREQNNLEPGFIWVITKEQIFNDDEHTQNVTTEVIKEAKLKVEEIPVLSLDSTFNEVDNLIDNPLI